MGPNSTRRRGYHRASTNVNIRRNIQFVNRVPAWQLQPGVCYQFDITLSNPSKPDSYRQDILVSKQELLEQLGAIARQAGSAILDVYASPDFDVQIKSDDSPLTRADLAAHRIIEDALNDAWPEIPVLSEESGEIPFSERQAWSRYFLVDPLDGTKEFINRNGEFTVNIALIEDGEPAAGVVYVPVKEQLFAGAADVGAWIEQDGNTTTIATRSVDASALTVVASRRHGGEALGACMEVLSRHFAEVDTANMGSSLKLCLVAAGEADLYPRLAPTSEWDTAAAHAIVRAAGGRVVDTALRPLRYNQKENILNPFFYVIGDQGFDWDQILSTVRLPD